MFYYGPDGLTVMGSVSAYSRGDKTELGLCVAGEVNSFLAMADSLRSMEKQVDSMDAEADAAKNPDATADRRS